MPIRESPLQMHLPTLLSLCSTWWISPIATSMSRLFLLPVSLTVFSILCGCSLLCVVVLKECVSNSVQSCFHIMDVCHLRTSMYDTFNPQQSTPTYEACDASKCSKYHCRLQQNAICPLSGKSAHSEKTWGLSASKKTTDCSGSLIYLPFCFRPWRRLLHLWCIQEFPSRQEAPSLGVTSPFSRHSFYALLLFKVVESTS